MNIFTISSNDQSVVFLGQIFGSVGTVLKAQGNAPLILGAMFKTFNTVMLSLGALVIVYTTVVGLLATAHEGEFMGKKWSGLWVPLRSLIGIAALFPTTSGYSALQVIVMWIVLQGIGAADMLWNTVLNYTQVMGSPLSQSDIGGAAAGEGLGIAPKMEALFQSLSCQATALVKDKYKVKDNLLYYCAAKPGDQYCEMSNDALIDLPSRSKSSADKTTSFYFMGPGGECGLMSYCNPEGTCQTKAAPTVDEKIKCAGCKGQVAALNQIVSTLGKIAGTYSQTDNEYVRFSLSSPYLPSFVKEFCQSKNIKEEDCCIWKYSPGPFQILIPVPCKQANEFPSLYVDNDRNWMSPSNAAVKTLYWPFALESYLAGSNFIEASANFYTTGLSNALTSLISTLDTKSFDEQWRVTAQKNGWMVAGAFYNNVAEAQNNALGTAKQTFTVVAKTQGGELKTYRNNFEGASYLTNQTAETNPAAVSPQVERLSTELESTARGIFNNWRASMRSGSSSNPLAQIHLFGKRLLIVAEVLYPVLVGVGIAIGATKISFIALGTGPIGAGEFIGMALLYGIVFPGFAILAICLSFGGMLAVYVPLIPYVIFTLSALGWFISTIEAMIASPLVALGILSPGGQHEILGRSEPALMLMLGVLLRPSLMIFGLIAAMLLSNAALFLVNNTFGMTMGAITDRPSITELVLFLATYTFLIVAILNKCFSMIHLIPERVMTWIGGQAVSYGEGEGAAEAKRGAEAAGAGAVGLAKAGSEKGAAVSQRKDRFGKGAATGTGTST